MKINPPTFIELYFHDKGELPSPALLKLKGITDSPQDYNEQLQNRGLPTYSNDPPVEESEPESESSEKSEPEEPVEELPGGFTSPPDPRAILAANLVLQVEDKRSLKQKLNSIEVSLSEWNAFLENKEFSEWFGRRLEETSGRYGSLAKLGMGKGLAEGDLNFIKYWHEFSGEYKPNQEEVTNLKMVIALLMEILVKYVQPDQLPTIANEIEAAIAIAPTRALTKSGL